MRSGITLEDLLRDLADRVSALERAIQKIPVREAQQRAGAEFGLATLSADLNQGAAANSSLSCVLPGNSPTTTSPGSGTLVVSDVFLQSGFKLPSGTLVRWERDPWTGAIYVTGAQQCSAVPQG